MKAPFILIVVFFLSACARHSPAGVAAPTDSQVRSQLKWFDRDPRGFMERDGNSESDPAVLKAKNQVLDRILASSLVPIEANPDRIEDFLDPSEMRLAANEIVRSPERMDELGLQSADLGDQVWSGGAWATYRGHSAQRYNLPAARTAADWLKAWDFFSAPGHSYEDVATGKSPDLQLDDLSPAEKYDLLISRPQEYKQGLLTKYEWDDGRKIQEQDGTVPHWYGYCHGWASSSFMMPRPQRSVGLTAADGETIIRFYPSDIKALATVLWANALPAVRWAGTRCDQTRPAHDANGRITDPNCVGVNAGLFHMAIVNQLGNAKRPLILDVSANIEVWNQPLLSYAFRYFNPQAETVGLSFDDSVVALEDFSNDKFKAYRSADAKRVVGVVMTITYARETPPNHRMIDSHQFDAGRTVNYLYDLELDENDQIVGGEWYQSRHPSFLWDPPKGAEAKSPAESSLTEPWQPDQPAPPSWQAAAVTAAAAGVPLAHIVETLDQLAHPH